MAIVLRLSVHDSKPLSTRLSILESRAQLVDSEESGKIDKRIHTEILGWRKGGEEVYSERMFRTVQTNPVNNRKW